MTKKKKPWKAGRGNRKKRPTGTRSRPVVSMREVSFTREAEYIVRRAEEHDARIVTLGQIVFFSTDTGDAWMLDPEDGYAMCLARDGDRQPFQIVETAEQVSIAWHADYEIVGDHFVVRDREGRERQILGYPTREILDAVNRLG